MALKAPKFTVAKSAELNSGSLKLEMLSPNKVGSINESTLKPTSKGPTPSSISKK